MAKEILFDGPEGGQKKTGLRVKVGDLLGTLTQTREEKKSLQDVENERLLESFRESYANFFKDGYEYRYVDEDLLDNWRRREDALVFENLQDMKYKMMDGTLCTKDRGRRIPLNLQKIVIEGGVGAEYGNNSDLAYIFKRMLFGSGPLYLKFPDLVFARPNDVRGAIKMLQNLLLSTGGKYGCYFDIGDFVPQDELKDFVTWFTKKGKSGKIHECVIKANGKEYHSGGDYRYEFA